MRKLPPMTELRAFEAAARHLSFKRAAAELYVTPTAISHQIKLLERYCGRALFRRRPRPLKLTTAGEQLFPVVRDSFQTFADVLATMRPGTTWRASSRRWSTASSSASWVRDGVRSGRMLARPSFFACSPTSRNGNGAVRSASGWQCWRRGGPST